jgi:hypothetical protein
VRYAFVDCRWELGSPGRGRELYLAGHIPGAAFLDVDADLSAPPGAGGRHPLPDAGDFARSASQAGIGDGVFVVAGDQRIRLGDDTLDARSGLHAYEGKDIVLGIRPEDLEDAALEPDVPADRRLHGRVALTEALGSEVVVHFEIDARPALTEDIKELARDVGEEVETSEDAHTTVVGRFGARTHVRPGDTVDVAVDTRSLHFFDPETGAGIYDQSDGKGAQPDA